MTQKATRRSPRGESRRAEIIEAAAEEFAVHGYHGASVAAIAEKVGITQSGLLHHYPSKEALMDAVVQSRFADDLELVTRLTAGETSPFAAYDALVSRNTENRTWVQFLMVITAEGLTADNPAHELIRARYDRVREQMLQRILLHAGDEFDIPTWIDRKEIVSLFLAAVDGLQLQWLYDDSIDMRKQIKLLIDLMNRAHGDQPASPNS